MSKRSYRSPRRTAQARATRLAVLEAAHDLFVEHGYAGTSIRAVAARAEVGEQTVYRLFSDKATLLREVTLHAVAGGEVPSVARESELKDRLDEAPDAYARLSLVVEWLQQIYERGLAELEEVITSAAAADPRVAELARFADEQRDEDNRWIVTTILRDTPLPDGVELDDVVDYLDAVENSFVYQRLVKQRGWSPEKYAWWAERLVQRLFLDDAIRPPAGNSD
jgi:TetR/AcrR family transcriptional regulator of autoinduction and epiphytic fitness